MILYCDTSALAKRYIDESGTKELTDLLSQSTQVFTSALTELELFSFLERSKKISRISTPQYRNINMMIEKDFQSNFLKTATISKEIVSLARRFIRQRFLRPADSIQLATAFFLSQKISESLLFCAADHHLLKAARMEGLKCEDFSLNEA